MGKDDYFKELREQLGGLAFTMNSAPCNCDRCKGEVKMMYKGFEPTHEGVDEIVQAVRDLADEEPGINLEKVSKAVDVAKDEYRRRIERALKGIADLETTKKQQGRRFLVAYWYREASAIAEGIVYPERKNDKGEPQNYSVLVNSWNHPFLGSYKTMEAFRKFFADSGDIPYTIVYRDDK